jgi:hypothetical protein
MNSKRQRRFPHISVLKVEERVHIYIYIYVCVCVYVCESSTEEAVLLLLTILQPRAAGVACTPHPEEMQKFAYEKTILTSAREGRPHRSVLHGILLLQLHSTGPVRQCLHDPCLRLRVWVLTVPHGGCGCCLRGGYILVSLGLSLNRGSPD